MRELGFLFNYYVGNDRFLLEIWVILKLGVEYSDLVCYYFVICEV